MIEKFGKPGAIYACVSDSYDLEAALEKWKQLEPLILEKGGTLVVRPDSGNPIETPIKVVKRLFELFGHVLNDKGYKVLPDHVRVIQGDGVEYESIRQILVGLHAEGISADNIAYGMGGALLQKHDRDTFKFAYKMCSITVNGEERDVYKDPVTDPGKRSKAGRLTTVVNDCGDIGYERLRGDLHYGDMMSVVWKDGELVNELMFNDICFK
jgi:nicotinamide phosphoribosyltransferase